MRSLQLIILIFLTGCSLFYKGPRTWQRDDLEGAFIEKSSKDGIYKISCNNLQQNQNIDECYITAISTCGLPNNHSKKLNLREILVGLKKIELIQYTKENYQDYDFGIMTAHAFLDDVPINLKAFSILKGNCRHDLIAWHNPQPTNTENKNISKNQYNVFTEHSEFNLEIAQILLHIANKQS
ncbi:MAG TPA: hypothetical protein PKD37_00950 [Oligoflexia bacterium]|nr:hypothetical protein [Oligoflexia bacterium]HMP26547.1 hypothetical protein [Oligoflexia bacterium]